MIRFAETTPNFAVGQLVRHLRYNYRGLIVGVDSHCRADQAWYLANRTQPDQCQAWYHVFVDGGGTTTYVAESNLASDPSDAAVDHPLVVEFFTRTQDGRYQRNDRPWVGW